MAQPNGEVKPFHETIVPAIQRASTRELEYLASLIKKTKIPKNHDVIITAWNKRCEEKGRGDDDFGVTASLLAQKQAAAAAKPKEVGKTELRIDDPIWVQLTNRGLTLRDQYYESLGITPPPLNMDGDWARIDVGELGAILGSINPLSPIGIATYQAISEDGIIRLTRPE
jgi:hypothetical protein